MKPLPLTKEELKKDWGLEENLVLVEVAEFFNGTIPPRAHSIASDQFDNLRDTNEFNPALSNFDQIEVVKVGYKDGAHTIVTIVGSIKKAGLMTPRNYSLAFAKRESVLDTATATEEPRGKMYKKYTETETPVAE